MRQTESNLRQTRSIFRATKPSKEQSPACAFCGRDGCVQGPSAAAAFGHIPAILLQLAEHEFPLVSGPRFLQTFVRLLRAFEAMPRNSSGGR